MDTSLPEMVTLLPIVVRTTSSAYTLSNAAPIPAFVDLPASTPAARTAYLLLSVEKMETLPPVLVIIKELSPTVTSVSVAAYRIETAPAIAKLDPPADVPATDWTVRSPLYAPSMFCVCSALTMILPDDST